MSLSNEGSIEETAKQMLPSEESPNSYGRHPLSTFISPFVSLLETFGETGSRRVFRLADAFAHSYNDSNPQTSTLWLLLVRR
jgi:hypothetical protein